MTRPLLLDLFCGAGGAAMGYHRAGFDVVGVDLLPQPRYPFTFHRADAMTFPLDGFEAIHASPPCQRNVKGLAAVNATLGRVSRHANLIEGTRARLQGAGVPYVIENVVGAELRRPVRLCGTSFGLPVRRHRLFESTVLLLAPDCAHGRFTEKRFWTGWRPGGQKTKATTVQVYGNGGDRHEWGPALGIDWMTYDELAQAIPPAFTELVGRALLAAVETA